MVGNMRKKTAWTSPHVNRVLVCIHHTCGRIQTREIIEGEERCLPSCLLLLLVVLLRITLMTAGSRHQEILEYEEQIIHLLIQLLSGLNSTNKRAYSPPELNSSHCVLKSLTISFYFVLMMEHTCIHISGIYSNKSFFPPIKMKIFLLKNIKK